MPTLKTLRTLLLNMFKLIELLKVEEELIEHMVELVLIFHLNVMSKCGLLKNHKMLENKEKLNKLLKVKFQLDKND
jgi:hypothetical protein